jgi:uncharacterized protein
MKYEFISADCHIDLIWLPPDLFTSNSRAELRERMPFVTDTRRGKAWVAKNGAKFGLMNGMGSAGREYVPGQIHRSDRMASTALYDDGRKGIRRLTDPELRLKDQERDGVQAEVLYGVLGASMRLNDDEAATEMVRIYNEWLADFCRTHPDRYAGLASIPSHNIDAAVAEARRVARTGVLRGLDIANRPDLQPFWDPCWEPLWTVAEEAHLPIHLHTIGGSLPDLSKLAPKVGRAAFATMISSFQMYMALPLMAVIFSGVLEHHPGMRMVIGESGIGWLPYVLDHMDLEWEDQFHDLDLKMKPSEYWRRQCYATYQSDRIGIKMLDEIGEDNIMWGSDFPHPDGIWPDSQDYIRRELGHLPEASRRKIVCTNAGALYRFTT